MAIPQRIQRMRTKGFRLQEVSQSLNGLDCVCVTRPGPYGNPYAMKDYVANPEACLEHFRQWAENLLAGWPEIKKALRGKNLACWCAVWECRNGHKFGEEIRPSRVVKYCRAPKCSAPLTRVACHADIWLELVNE